MTDSQTIKLAFDHEMQFPNDLKDSINNSTARAGEINTFLTILLLDGDTSEIDENLSSWAVEDVSSSEINIKLTFKKLINVS